MTLSLGWSILLVLLSASFAAGGAFAGVRVCLREHGRRISKLESRVDTHEAALVRLQL